MSPCRKDSVPALKDFKSFLLIQTWEKSTHTSSLQKHSTYSSGCVLKVKIHLIVFNQKIVNNLLSQYQLPFVLTQHSDSFFFQMYIWISFRFLFTFFIITLLVFKIYMFESLFKCIFDLIYHCSLCFLSVYLNIWNFIICDYQSLLCEKVAGREGPWVGDPSNWCIKTWSVLVIWLISAVIHLIHFFCYADFVENGKIIFKNMWL